MLNVNLNFIDRIKGLLVENGEINLYDYKFRFEYNNILDYPNSELACGTYEMDYSDEIGIGIVVPLEFQIDEFDFIMMDNVKEIHGFDIYKFVNEKCKNINDIEVVLFIWALLHEFGHGKYNLEILNKYSYEILHDMYKYDMEVLENELNDITDEYEYSMIYRLNKNEYSADRFANNMLVKYYDEIEGIFLNYYEIIEECESI